MERAMDSQYAGPQREAPYSCGPEVINLCWGRVGLREPPSLSSLRKALVLYVLFWVFKTQRLHVFSESNKFGAVSGKGEATVQLRRTDSAKVVGKPCGCC